MASSCKARLHCDNYKLLKVDKLDNTPISNELTNEFTKEISSVQADVIVFSDFRHGIFHKQNINHLTSSIRKGTFKAADSQVASRWGNITEFIGFDLVTPNEREARFSVADQDSAIGPLAGKVYSITQAKNLILKLGERGVIGLAKLENEQSDILISLDSFADNPIDPVGAGDALMAYSVLTLKVTGSLPMAAVIGSIAAACESERIGNIPITRENVLDKILKISSNVQYLSS